MKKLVTLFAAGIILAGCNQGKTDEHKDHETHTENKTDEVKKLTVDLTAPEKAELNKATEIKAEVKYGGKAVNDADEVMFEIIKDKDNKNSVKKMVKEADNGVYTLNYKFDKDGSYNVIAHVTAHSQHTMPNKDITVGEGHHEHAHHEGGIHIMEIKGEKNKPINLMIHVSDEDGNAKKGAEARLEVTTPDKKTEWIDLKETKDGQYEAEHTFKQSGKYDVKAHAEGDHEFHVHAMDSFEIK